MGNNWSINKYSSKAQEERQEALKRKIEADKKCFASCYLVVEGKLQIHIFDKLIGKRYLFVCDENMKQYIDELKAKGYYEFVSLSAKQQENDEDKNVYYLQYRCPYELYTQGGSWSILHLHHLVIAVNLFEPKCNFEAIKKANEQRALLTNKNGLNSYVIDHISNKLMPLPYQQQSVDDENFKPVVEPGNIFPIVTPKEAEAYKEFCEILPKLDEDFIFNKVVCITPCNLNHAQCNNTYNNLALIKKDTNYLKSKVIDRFMGIYAELDHQANTFIVTFYTQSAFWFGNDRSHRFSVVHKLPTCEDKIEQVKLQAEELDKIYTRYNNAREEAQEIYDNYWREDTTECWNDIKQVYSLILYGKEIHYITAEEMNKDFKKLWLDKEIVFAPGDERVKIIERYTTN